MFKAETFRTLFKKRLKKMNKQEALTGKATARAVRALLKRPKRKTQISTTLVSRFSPSSKSNIFTPARKRINIKIGCVGVSGIKTKNYIFFGKN